TAGAARITGQLADGTKVSFAGVLSKMLELPFYHASNRGYAITGPVSFHPGTDGYDLDGALLWFRGPDKKSPYPDGWPSGLGAELMGDHYTKPAAGVSVFSGLSSADGDGNALLTLLNGGFAPEGLAQALNIGKASDVQA